VDENVMLWSLHDVVAFGAEHWSLEKTVSQAAARLHMTISPGPLPDHVVIRSDQYSFVKQSIFGDVSGAGHDLRSWLQAAGDLLEIGSRDGSQAAGRLE
jgi:hypothetical protein